MHFSLLTLALLPTIYSLSNPSTGPYDVVILQTIQNIQRTQALIATQVHALENAAQPLAAVLANDTREAYTRAQAQLRQGVQMIMEGGSGMAAALETLLGGYEEEK